METIERAVPVINDFEIDGKSVTIRPIERSDVHLEEAFINALSPEAKRNRFLCGVHQLPEEELQDLCDVDYHNSMAFIAVVKENDGPRQLGVARYCRSDKNDIHEMAIAVADPYRHSDLGAVLMKALIDYAREHDIEHLSSVDFYDN